MAEKDTLDLNKYPLEFQEFLKSEIKLIKEFLGTNDTILDVGCGTGRAIKEVAPLVSKYTGIDIDEEYLTQARNNATEFNNSNIIKQSVENLSNTFSENEFTKSICLFNTITCFKDYKKALKEIYHVTKKAAYFSICAKGSMDIRKKYYDMIGVKVHFDENETSFSNAWGQVYAFDENEIRTICEEVGFKVNKIILFSNYSYGVIVSK